MKKTTLILSLLLACNLQVQTMEHDNDEEALLLCVEIANVLRLQGLSVKTLEENKRKRAGTETPSSIFHQPREISSRSTTPSLYNPSINIPSPKNMPRVNQQATHAPAHNHNTHWYSDFPGGAYYPVR